MDFFTLYLSLGGIVVAVLLLIGRIRIRQPEKKDRALVAFIAAVLGIVFWPVLVVVEITNR